MAIYLIRHAEKEIGNWYHDRLPMNDQPISANGVAQSRRLVQFFETIQIDGLYVSEYQRTSGTIAPVADRHHMKPIVDSRLNEINVGVVERMTTEQIKRTYPEYWAAWIARERDFRIPGGETGEEATRRIMSLFHTLDHTKNHILVSHDGLIRILLCAVLSLPPYRRHLFSIDTCSITVLEYLDECTCWSVAKLNMTLDPGR